MTLDTVNKDLPFFHMTIVIAMVFVGVPRIFSYTALVWGCCAIMSIPLTEERFSLKLPVLWPYRHLLALGVCYMVSMSL